MKVYVGYEEYGEYENFSEPEFVTTSEEEIKKWREDGKKEISDNWIINYRTWKEFDI